MPAVTLDGLVGSQIFVQSEAKGIRKIISILFIVTEVKTREKHPQTTFYSD